MQDINQRRHIWFSQTPPDNKMDLWLSYNIINSSSSSSSQTPVPDEHQASGNEPSSRGANNAEAVDITLKVYDCGKWITILQNNINGDLANKINVVSGATEYDIAVFTGSSSDYNIKDGGKLGTMLNSNTYVSSGDWMQIINNENYHFSEILQQTVWNIISDPQASGDFQIPVATSVTRGGIKANSISTSEFNNNRFSQIKIYPENERLFADCDDIIAGIQNTTGSPLYETLGSGSSAETQYVISGGGQSGTYLNNNGGWSTPVDTTYDTLGSVNSSGTSYVVRGGGGLNTYLGADGQWSLPAGKTYQNGLNIYVDNDEGTINLDARRVGSGWMIVSSGSSGTDWVQVDGGLKIDYDYHKIMIDTSGATKDNVLGYDGTGIAWMTVQGGSGIEYTAGNGISISTGHTISCEITQKTGTYSVSGDVEFRAVLDGGGIVKNVIKMIDSNHQQDPQYSPDLYPFEYINLSMDGAASQELTFNIPDQTSVMDGNPIYVLLTIPSGGKPDYINLSGASGSGDTGDFIIVNEAAFVGNDDVVRLNSSVNKYLVTMQFGKTKIEPIGKINGIPEQL